MQTPYTIGPAMLTSLERVAFYLGKDIGRGRVDGISKDTPAQRQTRRSLLQWILDVSAQVQQHCNREFLIQERTQYFDVLAPIAEFFPAGVPILSITELAMDPLGQYLGNEYVIDSSNYLIGSTGNSFGILWGAVIKGPNALRAKTVGGLAYHGTQSTFAVAGVTGKATLQASAPSSPLYAIGGLSESVGRVVSYTEGLVAGSGALVIDVFAGVFQAGEPLTFQSEIDAEDLDSVGATIAAVSRQSLCEAFPDIARALDIEIRYLEKHAFDFENASDGGSKSGATRRHPRRGEPMIGLQEETEQRLSPYRRYLVGT
jgi:hypothetical protein